MARVPWSSGPLVRGPVVLLSFGPLMSFGPLVLWSSNPLIFRSSPGPPVLWSWSVVPWSRGPVVLWLWSPWSSSRPFLKPRKAFFKEPIQAASKPLFFRPVPACVKAYDSKPHDVSILFANGRDPPASPVFLLSAQGLDPFQTHRASIVFANVGACKLSSKHMIPVQTHGASVVFANGGGGRVVP